MEIWDRLLDNRDTDDGRPVYERIADAIAAAIDSGDVAPGVRLPTVRELSRRLNVSSTTVMSVYNRLGEKGMVRGETGRGTFVNPPAQAERHRPLGRAAAQSRVPVNRRAWRRRLLAQSESRLQHAFPTAVDLMRGSPDRALYPLTELKRAYRAAVGKTTAHDLEYPRHLDLDPVLAEPILAILDRDEISATSEQLLVMNSSQQFLQLFAHMLMDQAGDEPVIAVEEPGYQTAMDTFEHAGCLLLGVPIDQHGMNPAALDDALNRGASAVLFTPRVQSPTGTSWSSARRRQLADVLAQHPDVKIFEDDHFAEASARPGGSLYSDRRLRGRVVYVRSFAKSIAPDLRVAVGVADPSVRSALNVQKSFADGWTSRIGQRTLGHLLAGDDVFQAMDRTRAAYAERRAVMLDALTSRLAGSGVTLPEASDIDGLHVWLTLPVGCSADQVAEYAAQRGFLVAPGEPFYVQPGNESHLRVNAGAAVPDLIREASSALADAVERAASSPVSAVLTP
ncbi:PLP-dependent aminotransferase family protein [Phytoactinopolyspora alkaliphila]|uniref:PLP-dependent aminotransferase family protein n=1 Tax=Phytoactinopolyspora alkaliphila TaxID=1783498 RepID=A0A6N9YJS5_9ACTN|nr:PLP-dependent aminotransferase family protein [Phytoactinopolyspora alkaliphila]NED95214.1 PLP-dependent aminotransferase family protein [Phytoactinopolyspora alkaliphila]